MKRFSPILRTAASLWALGLVTLGCRVGGPAETPMPSSQAAVIPSAEENPSISITYTQTAAATTTRTASFTSTPSPTDFISNLIQTPPKAGRYDVSGFFTFKGKPVSNETGLTPQLTGTISQKSIWNLVYNPESGRFFLPSVPGGMCFLVVTFFPDDRKYPLPGDLASQNLFFITGASEHFRQDLEVYRNLHLTAPFDNADPMPQPAYQVFPAGELEFRWEPVAGSVRYRIMIREVDGATFTPVRFLADAMTTELSYTAVLYPIPEDHFFGLLIYASDGITGYVGQLMVRLGSSGYGWEYRFRMQ